MRKRFSLAIILSLSSLLMAAVAANASKNTDYLSIPLLYLSDRARSEEGFGPFRKTENGTSIYDLNCGSAEFTIKVPEHKPLDALTQRLGWHEAEKMHHSPIDDTPFPQSGTPNAFDSFNEAIIGTARRAEAKTVFIIIHGFNSTFDDALEGGAQLAYSVRCPVIVYDWPSIGRLGKYTIDAENNEWSQEHFDRFLEELKKIEDRSGLEFVLVAHSMGNRLAVRSAPILKGKHLFKDMFLVDPDFDAETFVHYMVRYARKTDDGRLSENQPTKIDNDLNNSDRPRVRILFSHRDHALPFAEFLFGGYTRLGQAADSMLSSIFNLSAVTDMFNEAQEHLNKFKHKDKDPRPQWLMKFEWIDYTVLDHGIVGHTIPFDLIANLWRSEQPGDGLKLVESDNGAPNKLSRLFLNLLHQKSHISSRLGKCLKVEEIDRDKNKHSNN